MLPRNVYRRRRAVAVLIASAAAGVGLGAVVGGLGGVGGPAKISGSPSQAYDTVQAFQFALARHDWATICNKLYSDDARRRAGGSLCPAALASAAGEVRQPKADILSIDASGDRATVVVSASINGQAPVTSQIHLVREHGGYRITYSPTGGIGD
jgi:hypothetical protein